MNRTATAQRNVSIDILRIMLALMVVTIHIGAPSTGHVINSVSWMPMKFFAYIMHSLAIPAVNIYILISGYFSYKELEYTSVFKKAASLWSVLLFYSLAGMFVSSLFFDGNFSLSTVKDRVFLLSTGEWWFMTNYFCLIFISPLLNILISSFTKKTFVAFVFMVGIVFGTLPSLCEWKDAIGINYGYSLIWFIVLYLIGGGIKKLLIDKKIHLGFWKYFGLYLMMTLFILAQDLLFSKVLHCSGCAFVHYNCITILMQAIFLFLAFLNLQINCKMDKVIVLISSLSMSVYIFHCQADFGKMLWNLTEPSKYADTIYLPLIYLAITFGVFCIACSIEYVRLKLFKIIRIDTLSSKLVSCSNKCFDQIFAHISKFEK